MSGDLPAALAYLDAATPSHQRLNVPTIAVRDLVIQRRENDLVLATFGRGFYILDDYTPLRSVDAKISRRNGTIKSLTFSGKLGRDTPLTGDMRGRSQGRRHSRSIRPMRRHRRRPNI